MSLRNSRGRSRKRKVLLRMLGLGWGSGPCLMSVFREVCMKSRIEIGALDLSSGMLDLGSIKRNM